MIAALLAVKNPSEALTRLDSILGPTERRELAWILCRQAIEILAQVPDCDERAVVSADQEVLRAARGAGLSALRETTQTSHSASADWGCQRLLDQGAKTVLLLPIDTPGAAVGDISTMIDQAANLGSRSIVLAPDLAGTGTNAMARTPPDAIPCRFGPGSLKIHQQLAEQAGIQVGINRSRGLAFDMDTPEDVAAYLATCPGGAISDYLTKINASQRLREYFSGRSPAISY